MLLRNRKNQKAAKAAAFGGLSWFSAGKSTKTSRTGGAGSFPGGILARQRPASWGKLKKPNHVAAGTLVTESTHKVFVGRK